ncbi:MAG: hypothetical protein IPM66_18780 [Acidobacteriota bacterium]|nr:MAG: hypothetical protein IPM66_18780 [Acidobacteriota bacterium]
MAQLIQSDQGWMIEIPPDMAKMIGVPEGSIGVLHPRGGGIEVELLPPLDAEIKASVIKGCEELRETFEELKRRGD